MPASWRGVTHEDSLKDGTLTTSARSLSSRRRRLVIRGWIIYIKCRCVGKCTAAAAAVGTEEEEEEELVLKPRGDVFTKPLNSALLLTCEVAGAADNANYDIKWFGDNNHEIVDRSGRSVTHRQLSLRFMTFNSLPRPNCCWPVMLQITTLSVKRIFVQLLLNFM